MAKQTINIGTTANDGTGDPIRAAFGKVNDNFTEIYTANTGVNTGDQNLSAYATTAAVAAGYQPLDSDLMAISALTTTAYGRALLSTADAATLRSAIGVGQTDAPTFLAQTLTGQSLTGVQATSLVDLAATWNTTGNPSLIYGRVTNTNSGTTANLIDLGTFAGGSLFSVNKQGRTQTGMVGSSVTSSFSGILFSSTIHSHYVSDSIYLDVRASGTTIGGALGSGATLSADAPNILAQRNASAAQAFRVYNDYGAGVNFSRFALGFSGAVLNIGVEQGGTGTNLGVAIKSLVGVAIHVGTLATNVWNFANTGHFLAALDNTYDIGASGANRPKAIYCNQGIHTAGGDLSTFGGGGFYLQSAPGRPITVISGTSVIQLGGTTSAFPAIKRNGTGIDIRLADDSAFAPVKGKLTTDTAYTATTVVATGYITLYDSTGTAYRVPCAV